MGAMQAQRMMHMQGFDPESFSVPLDGVSQSGKTDYKKLVACPL